MLEKNETNTLRSMSHPQTIQTGNMFFENPDSL